MREFVIMGLIVLASATPAAGAGADPAAPPAQFSTDVAPILVRKCQGCHGPEQAKGGYRLDTFERLMKSGDSGDVPVMRGDPAASALFRLITSHDEKKRMPQKDDPLPAAQVATIERWILGGAKFDGASPVAPLATLVPAVPHAAAPERYSRPVPVLALAFNPDGTELAAGGYHEITVWNPASGELLRRIADLPQQCHAIAFAPDGAFLAVAAGTPGATGELRLIRAGASAGAKEAALVLDRTGDLMATVAFSADGKLLAAGGADGAVRLYEVSPASPATAPAARQSRVIALHSDWVTAVAFSPDGRRVASSSRDKTVRVIDAATGETLSAYFGHDGPVFAVAWDGTGERVLSAGREREVHVWDPKTEGKKTAEIGGFGGDVFRLVRAGESLFSAGADGKVRQHKVADRDLVRTFDASGDWVYALALNEKTGRVAAGSFDGTVRIFSVGDGSAVAQLVAAPGYAPGTAGHAPEPAR
jgi:hypothetical protein